MHRNTSMGSTISNFHLCIRHRSNRSCQAVKYASNSMCWFATQNSSVGWRSLALTLSVAIARTQIGLNNTYSTFILSSYEKHCNEGVHCWTSVWLTLICLCRSAEAFIYSNIGCASLPLLSTLFIFNFFCSGDLEELKFIFHQSVHKMLIRKNISNVSWVFVGESVQVVYNYVTVTPFMFVQCMKNDTEVQLYINKGDVKPTKVPFRTPGSDFILGNENSLG